ncbi:zinc finger MYM-type protein 1-like, partial [Aphis craccivora]
VLICENKTASVNINVNDIGLSVGKNILSDEEKFMILKNTWTPNAEYRFPVIKQGNQTRRFQLDWLRRYNCTFITTPFVNYRKATDVLNKHGNNEYHFVSAEKSRAFIDNYISVFCGHNNLPLRGHRDDGQLEINSAITGDQGVFCSLLAFRLDSGDEILRENLENCTKNATMISKTVQNDIIEVIYEVLINNIVGFTELFSTTGISIKEVILKKLNDFGLSLTNLRGQGYDGGSNMSEISKACEIPAIRNMFGTVGSISVFLSSSAKRNNTLIRAISNDSSESNSNKIKLKVLIRKNSNRETSYKAANFNSSVRRSEFLVSLEIVANLFAYTKTLSIQLQSSKQDLSMAKNNIKDIINLFNSIRENPENTFNSLFENAAKKAQMFGEEIKIPRLCGQQTQRSNIIVREPMDWFKVTIFIPFLDHIIHELDSRFNEKFNNIIALEGLIPANINFYDTKSILESAKFYCEDVEVSTATAERSFSTLRSLKNYLRSTMSEIRLNGLAMLNIHKEIDINQVVDTFARKKKRRMELED